MVWDATTNFGNPNYCVLEEDSAQIPSWDIMVSGNAFHSIPWGNNESERTSQDRQGRIQPIPEEEWIPEEGGDFRHHLCWFENLCRELCSYGEHICRIFVVPGGTELLQCQGHRTFVSVRSTSRSYFHNCGVGSSQVRQAFYFLLWPHSQPELGHSNFNYYIIIVELQLPQQLLYNPGVKII